MIVKSLALHNFGLYEGDHLIDLSQTSEDRPVILIGGLNGRGKTTILEAILLGLYGKQSFAFSASGRSYGAYLRQYISNGMDCHDACVELKLQIRPDQPVLTIRRTWSDAENPTSDHLSVYSEDVFDPYLTQNWATFIETVLPAGVSRLFFFDGEKISEFANDQTDERLQSAVKSLLGVDTIDRLISDLNRIVARQEIAERHGEKDAELIDLMETAVEGYETQKTLLTQIENAKIRMKELDQEENACKQEIIRHSGNLVQDKERYKKDHTNLQAERKALTQKVLDEAGGALPMMMVMPLLRNLQTRSKEEQVQRQRQLVVSEIRVLREKLERLMEKTECSQELSQAVGSLFDEYAEDPYSPGLGIVISERSAVQLAALCAGDLQADLLRIQKMLEEKNELENQLEILSQYIARADNEIQVEDIYEKLRLCVAEKSKCEQYKENLEQALQERNSALKQNEKAIRVLKQQMIEEEQGRLKEARTIRYANAAIQVMEIFRVRLQRSKAQRLSELVTQRFLMLSQKKNLVEAVQIDPETLTVSLLASGGEAIAISSLSAGERQLLVIALLWGLTSSLENPLPVVIDTPLARLDSKHRENFVTKYLPNAGQQVIVLSTDQEISEEYSSMLAPYTAAEFLLEYDAKHNRTSIQEGYFKW